MTALCVATNCHKIATMPHPSKPLKISVATIATNATSKNVYVHISPEEEHILPQG